jgi:hypothetical protein
MTWYPGWGYSEIPFEKWHIIKWEKVWIGQEFSAISKTSHTRKRWMKSPPTSWCVAKLVFSSACSKLKAKNLTMKTIRLMLKISTDLSYWRIVRYLKIHQNNKEMKIWWTRNYKQVAVQLWPKLERSSHSVCLKSTHNISSVHNFIFTFKICILFFNWFWALLIIDKNPKNCLNPLTS